ncbi:MAG: fluoride efflux transporter CrcB [Anaerolineaceae bacterium]|nr:MAG: fluoride efflux transporter CrcB [Anaerolineaceae bacterium]
MLPFKEMLLVGTGGFLGANARYVLGTLFAIYAERVLDDASIPYGTLIVNVTGSFALAFFAAYIATQGRWSPDLRLLISVGFFGAYTTFSTFSNESLAFLRLGQWSNALIYMAVTHILCLLAAFLGLWLSSRFW